MKRSLPPRTSLLLLATCLATGVMLVANAAAQRRPVLNVPATQEIEVLDPGVDPLGQPTVVVRDEKGERIVDVPPCVVVHKLYYSGDRTFQGPMLPGGPSVIVCNHPRSGERLYIDAQLLPGAPRVTYTSSHIIYDYGEAKVDLHFARFLGPKVTYRTGRTIGQRLSQALHVEQIKAGSKSAMSATGAVVHAAGTQVVETVQTVTTPAVQALQFLPFGKVLFSGDLITRSRERVARAQRDHEVSSAARQRDAEDLSLPTVR